MVFDNVLFSFKFGISSLDLNQLSDGLYHIIKLIPENTSIANISSESETIMVWSLDKNAWRDIRSNTIIEWRKELE